ncbi:MBL fold metallo-hydrolase [Segatella bryantii]|jgi:glyoxylase-like metal-dependent hydrolase (beta-lactamase superfamily II)|uniref:MBL fold metallo-hydrolase n=1 Tax=Segatella bryantii TaxID=77095 RepID=UPI00088135EA|nr:MBL fold metallo-hydrolase [Segatella bryantii]SDL64942.1 Glyoxylase, beta-lactamase superfamily II [Segatella bryantii]SDZ78914.1 Glyoxylase, beta-lactamase superfamily II [Segatella bryantii]
MLKIQRFACNMLNENCYVASDETKECIIVDCGAYYPEERQAIVDYINNNQLIPKHLICTHGHLDHNMGNDTIFEQYGLKPECSAGDEEYIVDLKKQGIEMFGIELNNQFPPVDHFFEENETINFGTHHLRIIATPGHSRGSVTFIDDEEHVAFTGDTLFNHSIGRTDFKGGSMFAMINSLRLLAQLPDNTRILPGHGTETTIGKEVSGNPYMDR